MTLEQYRNRTIDIQARIPFVYTLNDSLIDELMELLDYEYHHYADDCEKRALQTVIDTLDLIMTNPDILKLSMHDLLRIIQYHYVDGACYYTILPTFTRTDKSDSMLVYRIHHRIKQSKDEEPYIMKVRRSIKEKECSIQEINSDMMSLRGVDTSAIKIENKSNKNVLLTLIAKKESLQYDIKYLNKWIAQFKGNNKLIRNFLMQLDPSDKADIKHENIEIAKPLIIKHKDKFIAEC